MLLAASPHAPPAFAKPDEASPALRRVAQDFESVFLTQILGELSMGLGTPGTTGGGADDPFAGMLREEYAKLISRSGGIGVADAVLGELIKMQRAA